MFLYLEKNEDEMLRFIRAAEYIRSKGVHISQSIMKSLLDVMDKKECGLQTEAKFIHGKFDLFKPSGVQNAGLWFEYKATGGVGKDGKIPTAQYKKTKPNELVKTFAILEAQLENWKSMLSDKGLVVTEAPKKVVFDDGHLIYEINIDVMFLATKDIFNQRNELIVPAGTQVMGDIKTSGLLDNGFSDYGWASDRLAEKIKIMAQSEHYKYVWFRKFNEDIEFMFFVFSTTDKTDFQIKHINLDTESVYLEHESWIFSTVLWLEKYLRNGFPAYPTMKRCNKCPLKSGCAYKVVSPIVETIDKS